MIIMLIEANVFIIALLLWICNKNPTRLHYLLTRPFAMILIGFALIALPLLFPYQMEADHLLIAVALGFILAFIGTIQGYCETFRIKSTGG